MTGQFEETRYLLGQALVEKMRDEKVDVRLLRDMLSQKPDLSIMDAEDGLSALLWCVRRDQVKMAEMLIDAGADPQQLTKECGLDAVMVAAIYNSVDTMALLIRRGYPLGNRDAFGNYAIQHAVSGDCAEVVTMLLEQRPDFILLRDQRHHTLQEMAQLEVRKKVTAALDAFNIHRNFSVPAVSKPVIVRKFKPKGGA